MEECPQHIRTVVSEARSLWPEHISSDPSKLAECEFYLIEEMDSYLVVHHPYRSLMHLTKVLDLSTDEQQTAWAIVNDTYITDLPLLCAPHVIALMAIYLAFNLKPPTTATSLAPSTAASTMTEPTHSSEENQEPTVASPQARKFTEWLAESPVDIESIIESAQEIISLYETWETYNEKQCKDVLLKLIDPVSKIGS